MTVAPSAAAAAYQAIAKIGTESAAAGTSTGAAGASDFSQFLSQAMDNAVTTMKGGEQMAAKQATGQTDVVSVVNAINSAELTLDTVVAVRDKVIAAYQNIMQMPI